MADPRAASWHLPLRFAVVGLLNTAFGYVVFAGTLLAGAGSTIALLAGAFAGAAFNFQTSRHLVFRRRGVWQRFIAVYAVVLSLNWLALRWANLAGMSSLEAQAMLSLPVAAFSYICQKNLVFNAATDKL